MAKKKKTDSIMVASKTDELKWRAESMVRDALTTTPKFREAVRETVKELKRSDAKIKKLLK